MATDPFKATDTFRMNPVSLGALIGGVVAFIAVGAITAVLWVVLGVAVGAGLGLGLRRFGQQVGQYANTAERQADLGDLGREALYKRAQRLDLPGRSTMTRDELAHAIAEHDTPTAS